MTRHDKHKKVETENKTEPEKKVQKKPLDEKTLRKISNWIVVSGIIACVGLVIYAYQDNFNPHYPFVPPEFNTEEELAKVLNGEISAIITHKMGLQVTYTTTSLSAQNPIVVDAKMYPIKGTTLSPDDWNASPDHFYLLFPSALDDQNSQSTNGVYYVGTLQLTKSTSKQEYDGETTIKYQFAGDYKFAFVDQANMDSHKDANGVTRYTDTDLRNFLVNDSSITIGSSDATTTLHVGSIGMSLTFVLIGFGIVETREHIHSIVKWGFLRRYYDKEVKDENNEESSETSKHE